MCLQKLIKYFNKSKKINIEPIIAQKYVSEVLIQKKFAMSSYEKIAEALKVGGTQLVFFHIHHFLLHAMNIFKIIRPSPGKHNENQAEIVKRGKIVRKMLKIPKKFDSNKYSTVRNDFEHFDERLDLWRRESKSHWSIEMNLGDINKRILVKDANGNKQEIDSLDVFRNFNPETYIFKFFGKDYELKDLANFLEQISKN